VDFHLGNLYGRVTTLEAGHTELKNILNDLRDEVRQGNKQQGEALSGLEHSVSDLCTARDQEVTEHRLTRQRNDDRTWSLIVGMIMLGGSLGAGKVPLPPAYQQVLTVVCLLGLALLLGFLSVQRIKR
jgi:hypothetical protein